MKPRLSIIIPTMNEAGLIVSALQSLQPLRNAGHELVLVDGGSTDGTAELAEPLVDRLLVARKGRAIQMNSGASVALGNLFLFLHADTQVDTLAVERILAVLSATGTRWGRFDVRLSGRHPILRVIELMMNLRSRVTGIATGDQGFLVPRALFDQVGGFPQIPLMEDIAISKRLKRFGRPLCLRPPLITSSRRWERNGILRTIFLMWRLRLAYAMGVDPERLARRYASTSDSWRG